MTEKMTDRELDAAVATILASGASPTNCITCGWVKAPDDIHCVPPYSTSLDAAYRAYEEFRKQRPSWRLFDLTHDTNGNWHAVMIWSTGEQSPELRVGDAKTPARAWCLAILEASRRER